MNASFSLLCLAASLLSLASSQAPGDGEQKCMSLDSHPGYAEHVHPLMDSRDYPVLLPPGPGRGGVWSTLDLDANKRVNVQAEWLQSISGTCSVSLNVCGHEAGPQNNWIITQHISRKSVVGTTTVNLTTVQMLFDLALESCRSSLSCVEALSLYVWETSAPNAMSAANTDNYHFIANLGSGTTELTIDFPSAQHTGFYLGIRDNGTCVDRLDRVLVYYSTCGAATMDLVKVGEAVFSSGSVVQGGCVADSVAVQETGPLLVCSERGEWSVVSGCQCNTQHYMDNTAPQCLECPPNSEATQTGLTECTCVQDYYRAPDKGPSVACTQSPSAPRNVTVSSVTDTSVSLSWTAPEYSGGRDNSEITYTVRYTDLFSSLPVVSPARVSVTWAEVEGLTPFLNYTFSVTAENAVSSQDSDVTVRTANTTATTEEGVAAKVKDVMLLGSNGLQWYPPDPPHGHILHYNIKITVQPANIMALLERYNFTAITYSVWSDKLGWNITEGIFTIQIQAETRIGPGEFSDPFTVYIGENDETPASTSTIVLVSILVPAVLVVILIIAVLFVLGHVSGRLSQRGKGTQAVHHAKYDVNCPDTIEEYASIQIVQGRHMSEGDRGKGARAVPHAKYDVNCPDAIEEYASIRIMQGRHLSESGGGICIPPVPRTQRPSLAKIDTNSNECYCTSTGSHVDTLNAVQTQAREVQEATYAVLEAPHRGIFNLDDDHLYSLDPTYSLKATNPIFGAAVIDDSEYNHDSSEEGRPPSRSERTHVVETSVSDPGNRAAGTLQQKMLGIAPMPVSESVASNAYWNEGMGPLESAQFTPARHPNHQITSIRGKTMPGATSAPGSTVACTSDRNADRESCYLELSNKNTQ